MTKREQEFVDSLSLKDLDLPDSDVKPYRLREEYEKGLAEHYDVHERWFCNYENS